MTLIIVNEGLCRKLTECKVKENQLTFNLGTHLLVSYKKELYV